MTFCGKRPVGNFLKRCDTPLIRKPDFSTTDGCWLFDQIEGNVRSVVPHADNNEKPLHATPRWRPCHGR